MVSCRTDASLRAGYHPQMTDAEAAVLDAARKWLEAKEEMLAADQGREDPVETERALDSAEYELTNAVYRLLGREPRMPRD